MSDTLQLTGKLRFLAMTKNAETILKGRNLRLRQKRRRRWGNYDHAHSM